MKVQALPISHLQRQVKKTILNFFGSVCHVALGGLCRLNSQRPTYLYLECWNSSCVPLCQAHKFLNTLITFTFYLACAHVHTGQRTSRGSWFSDSTMWVLVLKLRLSGGQKCLTPKTSLCLVSNFSVVKAITKFDVVTIHS